MKVLWIGEEKIDVHWEENPNLGGYCESDRVSGVSMLDQNEIYIDSSAVEAVQARTLFHEMLHAVLHLRVGKSVYDSPINAIEELHVRALESVQDVLKDKRNRWFKKLTLEANDVKPKRPIRKGKSCAVCDARRRRQGSHGDTVEGPRETQ